MTGSAGAALFHPPAWFLLERSPGLLEVRDLERGDGFDIRGELREQLLQGDPAAHPTLLAMGAFEPTLQRFAEQFDSSQLVALTRGQVLRGAGFQQLFLELTARCNERCVHCYAGSSPERDETLSPELIEQALRGASELGFRAVQLTGGDPLLSPHCSTAARRVRELGFEYLEIYTNGLALRGGLYDTLRELRAQFAFSFYSAEPAVHDAMTQTPGSQARTLAAIRRAAADGLRVRASIIVNDRTAPTLAATRALLQDAGVPPTSIAVDQERGVGRGTFASTVWQASEQDGESTPAHSGTGLRGFGGKAAIAPDGEIYPCIFSRDLSLGNLQRQSLVAALSGAQVVRAQEVLAALDESEARMARLSCWECRLRSALCQPRTGTSESLVSLVSRGDGP